MKKDFSPAWIGSSQPRKQRKYLANAPLNIRHKLLSANLTKELRKKYGKRNFPLRKDDEVVVMRGEFKKKKGKVEKVDSKLTRIFIAGIFRSKKDGTKIPVHFQPSNLQITSLNLDDKKRKESLDRKLIVAKEKKQVKEKIEKPKIIKKTIKEKN